MIDLSENIPGSIILSGFAFVIVAAGLAQGMMFVVALLRVSTPIVARYGQFVAVGSFMVAGNVYFEPIEILFEKSFFGKVSSGELLWAVMPAGLFTTATLNGGILSYFGRRKLTWSICLSAFVATTGMITLIYRTGMPDWALFSFSVVGAPVSCYNLVHALRASQRIIDDPAQLTGSPDFRAGVTAILKDGSVLRQRPYRGVKIFHRTSLAGHPALHMNSIVDARGIFLRICNESQQVRLNQFNEPLTFPKIPLLWLHIPWDNVNDIKTEKIIGYSEARVTLRHSNGDLILEGISGKVRKLLASHPGLG